MSPSATGSLFVGIYTDEDVTDELAPALRRRGFVSESTAEAGNLGQPDEAQLTYAASRGLALLTYNTADFIELAEQWFYEERSHSGIILSKQFSQRQFGELLRRVLFLLDRLTADELANQVLFLQAFKAGDLPTGA